MCCSHLRHPFLLEGDDHIVCVADAYDWNRWFIETWLKRFGVTSTFVDGRDSKEFERAIRPNTRLIYLESPTTFTFKLQNLKEVADIARNHRIKTVIDNTWATPFFRIRLILASITSSIAVQNTLGEF